MAFDTHVHTEVTSGGGTGGGSSVVALTVIDGQPVITFIDTTRGNKILSVTDHPIVFSDKDLDDLEWVAIGDAIDADSGYIAEFDGTIVYATGHCEDTSGNSKEIHLFLDGVDSLTLGTLTGGVNADFSDVTLNLDFSKGDRIRLQAQNGAGGRIKDTVVKVTLKWRG